METIQQENKLIAIAFLGFVHGGSYYSLVYQTLRPLGNELKAAVLNYGKKRWKRMWSLESCFKLCVRRRGWLFKEKQRDPLHPKRRKYLPPYCSWKHLDFPLHLVLHESDTSGSFSKLTCSQMECKGPACFYISVCWFKPRMMLQIAVGVGYGAKCSTWSLNFIKVPSHRLRLLDVIQSACSIFLSCELWPWFNLDRPYVPTHS